MELTEQEKEILELVLLQAIESEGPRVSSILWSIHSKMWE